MTSAAKTISPQNAQRLALWLAHEQPQLFAAIHAKVLAMKASGQLSGFGCGSCGMARSRKIGTFGRLGQTGFTFSPGSSGITSWDSSIGQTSLPGATAFSSGETALPGTTGITSWDSSIGQTALPGSTGATPGSGLQTIGTTAANAAGSSALTANVSGSSGFWSNFSSDVGSLGASVVPAIADVAGALTSGGTLGAIAGVVSAYYASEPSSLAAQTAATQVALTQAGQSPAAISGNTLYTATGTPTPVTSSLLSSLTPSEESLLIPILLIGAIALVLLA